MRKKFPRKVIKNINNCVDRLIIRGMTYIEAIRFIQNSVTFSDEEKAYAEDCYVNDCLQSLSNAVKIKKGVE